MDHSENDRRFCVYFFRCNATSEVRYVGHGNSERPYTRANRSDKLNNFIKENNYTVEIVNDNLSKSDAIAIESDYLSKYLGVVQDGFNLLNQQNGYSTKDIQYEEFSKYFYYDETSPTFLRWKVDRFGTGVAKIVSAGDVAGTVNLKLTRKYANVSLNYKSYQVHRIIYSLVNRIDLPTNLIVDHLDSNKHNNRIDNLQLVTQSVNVKKRNMDYVQSNNKTGVVGVHYLKTEWNEYWTASINYSTKKRKTKNFNIKKYGYDEAYRLACEWRKQMEDLYYNKPE